MQATDPLWPEVSSAELAIKPPLPLPTWKLIVTLFKLRIVTLLLLAAYGGAALGAIAGAQVSGWSLLLLTVVGTLSAAGASGINQYLERERDALMQRTARRPLPAGYLDNPRPVLWAGLAMVAGATLLAALINPALAFWSLMGALIYVGVYTIWLKPRTSLNIVIGGAAGSCAVISGGAAVGVWAEPTVWVLAVLLFVWTPVHFWSLALAYREDYARGDYPMLPVLVSAPAAAGWTALHTYLTVAAGLALGLWPGLNWLYLLPVGVVSLLFIGRTHALLRRPERKPALTLFHFSNLYLTLVLVMVMATAMVSFFWR